MTSPQQRASEPAEATLGAAAEASAAARVPAAEDDPAWDTDGIVDGRKVRASNAQHARVALPVARTDPTVPERRGPTCVLCVTTAPGVAAAHCGEAAVRAAVGGRPDRFLRRRVGPSGDGDGTAEGTLSRRHAGLE